MYSTIGSQTSVRSVLASDVTLVTSYGYCKSLKINDDCCLSYGLGGWGVIL